MNEVDAKQPDESTSCIDCIARCWWNCTHFQSKTKYHVWTFLQKDAGIPLNHSRSYRASICAGRIAASVLVTCLIIYLIIMITSQRKIKIITDSTILPPADGLSFPAVTICNNVEDEPMKVLSCRIDQNLTNERVNFAQSTSCDHDFSLVNGTHCYTFNDPCFNKENNDTLDPQCFAFEVDPDPEKDATLHPDNIRAINLDSSIAVVMDVGSQGSPTRPWGGAFVFFHPQSCQPFHCNGLNSEDEHILAAAHISRIAIAKNVEVTHRARVTEIRDEENSNRTIQYQATVSSAPIDSTFFNLTQFMDPNTSEISDLEDIAWLEVRYSSLRTQQMDETYLWSASRIFSTLGSYLAYFTAALFVCVFCCSACAPKCITDSCYKRYMSPFGEPLMVKYGEMEDSNPSALELRRRMSEFPHNTQSIHTQTHVSHQSHESDLKQRLYREQQREFSFRRGESLYEESNRPFRAQSEHVPRSNRMDLFMTKGEKNQIPNEFLTGNRKPHATYHSTSNAHDYYFHR